MVKVLQVGFVAGFLILRGGLLYGQMPALTEYDVKAAFLYNFAKFVEWPPEAFKNSENAFVVGILGEDPFQPDLEKGLNGQTVQEKKLAFKRLASLQETSGCQVVFI